MLHHPRLNTRQQYKKHRPAPAADRRTPLRRPECDERSAGRGLRAGSRGHPAPLPGQAVGAEAGRLLVVIAPMATPTGPTSDLRQPQIRRCTTSSSGSRCYAARLGAGHGPQAASDGSRAGPGAGLGDAAALSAGNAAWAAGPAGAGVAGLARGRMFATRCGWNSWINPHGVAPAGPGSGCAAD